MKHFVVHYDITGYYWYHSDSMGDRLELSTPSTFFAPIKDWDSRTLWDENILVQVTLQVVGINSPIRFVRNQYYEGCGGWDGWLVTYDL
jgi:hypothetical protein